MERFGVKEETGELRSTVGDVWNVLQFHVNRALIAFLGTSNLLRPSSSTFTTTATVSPDPTQLASSPHPHKRIEYGSFSRDPPTSPTPLIHGGQGNDENLILAHPPIPPVAGSPALPGESHAQKMPDSSGSSSCDIYQRQPLLAVTSDDDEEELLADPTSGERSPHRSHHPSYNGTGQRDRAGAVRLDLPVPTRDEPKFPKERFKTLGAFFFFVFSGSMNFLSIAIIHDWMPSTPPLPDIVLDSLRSQDWALDVCEILLVIMVYSAILLILCHRHRYIILRRSFFIMGLLYLFRALTVFVTVLPKSNPNYYCSPQLNHTSVKVIFDRWLELLSGMGLSLSGHHVYCGDFIYSGHTMIFLFMYLVIKEYSPRRWWFVHYFAALVVLVGVAMLAYSRAHYSIDIVLAYYITTRTFWIYHCMANNPVIQKATSDVSFLNRVFWFPLFQLMEKNVRAPLPRGVVFVLEEIRLVWIVTFGFPV
ncbi:unnamed protein product [Cyprideis torosa]|uniref:Sphingomyelin synthase-like domain-containing protein n=1 Tax=Cyprideis torosa TaxID=163714 RepID=A0A7R8W6D1_9CRUS|nr:unnamed protein product [Cyprideis torosa]CAG0882197.1 unnamed protein product [Cyprideis torosa]